MRAIRALADEYGLRVVEDACQAPGAEVDGQPAGAWGDAGVLSFGGSKLLTAGRGGAVLTRHADIHQRMKIFAQRGNDAFPLSELQAAVLLPQLTKLAARNAIRRQRAEQLLAATEPQEELVPLTNAVPGAPSYYKLAWRYRGPKRTREEFIQAVQAAGVALDAGFRGFTLRSARRCRKVGALPHSAQAAEQTVLLHHPVLLESAETVAAVAQVLLRASEC